jgi:hypothetical protein
MLEPVIHSDHPPTTLNSSPEGQFKENSSYSWIIHLKSDWLRCVFMLALFALSEILETRLGESWTHHMCLGLTFFLLQKITKMH